ncbi:MAG: porin, partial [Gammaproteobacteria bacterium]|nr:porin [Gammaproteobacteria bacterium]
MNKKLMSIAVAAAMAVPMAANAGGEATAYGQIHVALQHVTVGDADGVMSIDGAGAKANKLGMKGSVDTNLMDAKAVYQFELGLNQDGETGSYFQRDTWAGLSSKSLGTVRGGTMATGWKSTSAMVDPLFTTALEGRGGVVGGASGQLAGGLGTNRGRATHTVRYDSPSMGGAKVVANYSFAPDSVGDNNIGLGVIYKPKG